MKTYNKNAALDCSPVFNKKQKYVMKTSLSQEKLKSILKYEPDTGQFKWIGSKYKKKNGKIAGSTNKLGYRVIRVEGTMYLAHRLAWLYMEGYFPEYCVDHIDRVKLNNKWDNLREASFSCNNKNVKKRRNNKSGVTGVHWDKRRKKWTGSVRKNGKPMKIGFFYAKEDAIIARYEAEKKNNYPECTTKSDAFNYLKENNLI